MRVLSFFDPNVRRVVNEKNVTVGAIIKAFYYNILRYNDNSSNIYYDTSFLSAIISGFSFMMTCGYKTQELEKESSVEGCIFVLKIETGDDRTYFNENEELLHERNYIDVPLKESKCVKEYNELYFEIIEMYRQKDLILPSTNNRMTCAIVYFYGRCDLYGILNLNYNYLLFLLNPLNFISMRCLSAEIITFKLILENHTNFLLDIDRTFLNENIITNEIELLNLILGMDYEVQLVVCKTILNMISSFYKTHVKNKLHKVLFYEKLKHVENSKVMEKF